MSNRDLPNQPQPLKAVNNESGQPAYDRDHLVFLDPEFCVKGFTEAAAQRLFLNESDVGRSVHNVPSLHADRFRNELEAVVHARTPRTKDVQTPDGSFWTLTISPEHPDSRIAPGLVLTFSERIEDESACVRGGRPATNPDRLLDAQMVHDLDGRVLGWNRGAEVMLGYSEQEALQLRREVLIPEELRREERSALEQFGGDAQFRSSKSARMTRDGRRIDVWVSASASTEESGRPMAIRESIREITNQAPAAEQLAAVLESAIDAILTVDRDGIIRSSNPSCGRMFGYTADEMLGNNIKMLMPSPHREEHDRYLEDYRKTGIKRILGIGREALGQRKDGSSFPIDIAVTEAPLTKLYTWIVRDLSQRNATELRLRESERMAKSTLDGLSAHIAIVGEDGLIVAVNQAWRDFELANGGNPTVLQEGADYLGVCDRAVGPHSDEAPLVAEGIRAVLKRELASFAAEYPCHSPDHKRWFVVRITPFPGEGPVRVVVAHEDITSRKYLEYEVVAVASSEQRRIGQDLHDSIGQELTALSMLASILSETPETNSDKRRMLINRISEGLKRTQRELRTVMRGLLPVAVDAEGLMSSLSDLADRVSESDGVTCWFVCPKPVSVPDNNTATHLFLIAQEAVHNAIKHANAKNIIVQLSEEDELLLRIEDDGIGMQHKSTDQQGFGLRIMRYRATIIEATLTVEPRNPAGTLVSCSLARGKK